MTIEAAIREAVEAAVAPLAEEVRALRALLEHREQAPTPLHDPEQRFGLAQASAISGKHRDTLRRAIREGRLAATKAAGSREWTVRWADLKAFNETGNSEPVDDEAIVRDTIRKLLPSR